MRDVFKLKDKKLFSRSNVPLYILVIVATYLLIFQGYTTIWSIWVSMTDTMIGGTSSFIGLDNFIGLFKSKTYRGAIWFTIEFAFLSVLVKLFFGYIMALALNEPVKGRALIRALLFLPWALPTLSSVLTWRWMLGDVGGIVNYLLQTMHIIKTPLGWLGDTQLARISVVCVNIWRGTPFFGISILAALQSIPNDLYEVADLEGANWWQKLRNITFPFTKSSVLLVTLISTIWTLGDFSVIWLMTRGGPANATQVFSTLSYTTAFINLQLSKGIAISVSILPIAMIVMILVMKQMAKDAEVRL